MSPHAARLAALEAEAEALPEMTQTALRECEHEAYRHLMHRRTVLPGELTVARIEAKREEWQALKARMPDAHVAHEAWNQLEPKAEADRVKAFQALTRANLELNRVKGGQRVSLDHIHELNVQIRTCGADLDALIRAATVTAPEAA